MAQDMILLQPGAMPAHIANNPPPVSLNANAQQGVRLTFPVVSIEGRVWSVTLRGVETVIKASEGTDYNGKPLPEAPVRSLNVIIVGISPTISKVWYAKAFQPGQKAVLPDCFSINGETPDPTSPLRQSELCSTCPKNQFESAVSDDGTQGKGKACRDSRKIAVVPAGDIQNAIFGGPMMLRLPVMSLPNLAKYCGQLNIAGVDVTQVVTAMSFNMTVKYPEVVFTAVGYIQSAQDYADVCDLVKSDIVLRMLDEAPSLENMRPSRLEGPPVSSIEPTREQYRQPVDESATLIQNATARLTNEPDPDKWFALLIDCARACTTMGELIELRAIECIVVAGKKAPLKFRKSMTALWDETVARLSPAIPAASTDTPDLWDTDDVNGTEPARREPPAAAAPLVPVVPLGQQTPAPATVQTGTPTAFHAWLVDGNGEVIPDADGIEEAHADPVAYAQAYADVRLSIPVAEIEAFDRANHDDLRRAMALSTDATKIIADATKKPEPVTASPLLPMDMPADPWTVLDKLRQTADTPEKIALLIERNAATYEKFPAVRRTAIKALVEKQRITISPAPARDAPTEPTPSEIAEDLLRDIPTFETVASADTWSNMPPIKAAMERLRAEAPALHQQLTAAWTLRRARLAADVLKNMIRECATVDAITAFKDNKEAVAYSRFVATTSKDLWNEVKSVVAERKAELTR